MSEEVFREVSLSEVPNVVAALKEDWPKHFVLHQLLKIVKQYQVIGSKLDNKLYLCGEYQNGVYLNITRVQGTEQRSVYVDATSPDLNDVYTALVQTKLVPWQDGRFTFTHIHSRYSPTIQRVLASRNVKYDTSPNTMMWFPPEKEVQITAPSTLSDLIVERLDESFAQIMDSNWPHRSPGSDMWHKEHLRHNFGLGVFRKSDRRLLASALSNFSGGIFVLFCDPEFRGQGLATLLVTNIVKEIKGRGYIPFCTIILGNKASEQVFQKVGFEVFCHADYFIRQF